MLTFLKHMLFGLVIGLANIIPGVSGGTMAVVLNVYDRLINSISHFRKQWKSSITFLLAILIGACCAILLFSNGITFLLDHHYMATNFFFIGIIVGSIPMIFHRATADKFKPLHIIPCVITLLIMLITVYFVPSSQEVVMRTLTLGVTFKLFFISMIAAICMIIPGISGSFVMLLFGVYETITTAVSEMNIIVMIPIAIGCILGIVVSSKIIGGLLSKFPQATYFAILGFMIGSIPAIVDKISQQNAFVGGIPLAIGIVAMGAGALVSYLFSSEKFKALITSRSRKKDIAS